MKKKYYVESGTFKQTLIAENVREAGEVFLKRTLSEMQEIEHAKEKQIGFTEAIIVSEAGFKQDLERWGSTKQKLESIRLYTPTILRDIGEEWIADDMQKWVEINREKSS